MNPQELINTLKAQHRTLQADLAAALSEIQSEGELKTDGILVNLNKFKKDLTEHMKLENDVFYADYMNKKIKRGEDISSTKEFIQKMNEIAVVIRAFLDKYSTSEKINPAVIFFGKELQEIINTLNVRIETEEEGVFGLYLLM